MHRFTRGEGMAAGRGPGLVPVRVVLAVLVVVTLTVAAPTLASPVAAPTLASPVAALVARSVPPASLLAAVRGAGPAAPAGGPVRGAVVPHHLPAARLIAQGVAAAVAPGNRVILLAPNHANAGGHAAIASAQPWVTTGGGLAGDPAAVRTLTTASRLVGDEPKVIEAEHGIGMPLPFVSAAGAGSIVPIILRSNLTRAEIDELARLLRPLLDGHTVVVASVDFAHNVTGGQADLNDRQSAAALNALDAERFLGWGPEHSDGRTVLPLLVKLMAAVGAQRFDVLDAARSDRLGFGGAPDQGMTTYIVGRFVAAETPPAEMGRTRHLGRDGRVDAGVVLRVGAGRSRFHEE